MKLTAVVTCHERTDRLRNILGCLRYQTRPPDETLVYVSGVGADELQTLSKEFQDLEFSLQPDLEDWGHDKRRQGLADARGDVIGWFNDDDDYDRDYIQKLLQPIVDGADVAFCNWSHRPEECVFEANCSTSGNFLVRTTLAREVGWTGRDYAADGDFINGLAERTKLIVYVAENLYSHNPHERT